MSQTAPIRTLQLTPRDIEIILAVCDYDSLFSYQIRNRFWGQNSHPSTYYERLGDLIKFDYLRARPMNSLSGRGSGTRLITIGRASHSLLRERRGFDELAIKRLRHSVPLSDWPHDAEVRDVRPMLESAAANHPSVTALDWTNEAVYKRAPIKVELTSADKPGGLVTIKLIPDGGFCLELSSGQRKEHYLEVDRDTEHWSKIVDRIRAYCQHVGNAQIPVLWIVPSRRRAEQLAASILKEAQTLQARASIFAITTLDQVDERSILTSSIWQVVGVAQKRSLLPSSPQTAESKDGEVWLLSLGQETTSA